MIPRYFIGVAYEDKNFYAFWTICGQLNSKRLYIPKNRDVKHVAA